MIFDKIKHLSKKKGISIRHLEKTIGLSNGTICKWNESMPGVDKINAVAKEFGVPIEYFLEDDTKVSVP